MKKILFASTALFAVGAVSQAYAAEPLTARVSGYMHGGVFFSDADADDDGIGILRDGEIHLGFRGTSDNGLTFDGRVELEAFTSESDQIDENWVRVSGSFGAIKIGGDDSAKGAYANGVIYSPGARIGYFDGWGPSGVQPPIGGNNDSIGIHYDSPNFSGFQAGATFIPNTSRDNLNDRGTQSYGEDNYWAVGAVYSGDFGGFGVGISAAYGDSDGDDNENWHVGGNVSASGFTLAAHYEQYADDPSDGENTGLGIGASYATGPWTVAGGWGQRDYDDIDVTETVWAGWVSYAIAPGVTGAVGVEYGDPDNGDDEVLTGGAWLALSF